MQHVTSKDGTRIGFVRAGSGSPLLLVHGTMAEHSRWAAITPRFTGRHSVFAMDRRGRGMSGDAPEYALAREAEDVAAVVEAIGGEVAVLGHSHGGLCALEAALLTDRIRRLILYEPPLPQGDPVYPPDVPDRIQALVDRGEFEEALEVMVRDVIRMPDHEFEIYRQSPVWRARIPLAPTIPRELTLDRSFRVGPSRYAGVRVPTLLLLGGDSPPFFRRAVEAIHSSLPESRLTVLPGQQHIAMDGAPDEFATVVLEFLSDEAPQTPYMDRPQPGPT